MTACSAAIALLYSRKNGLSYSTLADRSCRSCHFVLRSASAYMSLITDDHVTAVDCADCCKDTACASSSSTQVPFIETGYCSHNTVSEVQPPATVLCCSPSVQNYRLLFVYVILLIASIFISVISKLSGLPIQTLPWYVYSVLPMAIFNNLIYIG